MTSPSGRGISSRRYSPFASEVMDTTRTMRRYTRSLGIFLTTDFTDLHRLESPQDGMNFIAGGR